MPQALGEKEIGPENEELVKSRALVAGGRITISKRETLAGGGRFFGGTVESTPCEILLDGEERIKRGKCLCGHFKTFGLRNGPCRHMLALRSVAMNPNAAPSPVSSWEDRIRRLFNN